MVRVGRAHAEGPRCLPALLQRKEDPPGPWGMNGRTPKQAFTDGLQKPQKKGGAKEPKAA